MRPGFWKLQAAIIGIAVVGFALTVLWIQRRPEPSKALPVLGQIVDFRLTNQLGEAVARADLLGTIWIADIIFTRCAGPCPQLSHVFQELQARYEGQDESVKLVSLTADPEFDTPDVLAPYAARFDANPERWQFLTGPRTNVYRLALEGLRLGVGENPAAGRTPGEDLFIHSEKFVLIDGAGRVRGYYEGLEPGTVEQLGEDVALLKSESRR